MITARGEDKPHEKITQRDQSEEIKRNKIKEKERRERAFTRESD